MGLPDVMQTGRSGMFAAKASIATTGHNIANANTEGYSRQRVQQATDTPRGHGAKGMIGSGTYVARVERINDEYIDKQIRNVGREMAHLEEKDIVLKQTEEIFNEMGGDGLNRLVARFFNEFRNLGNDPNSEAVRQSVREASQAMINDFHRLRTEVEDLRKHIDARLEGHVSEVNSLAEELKDLNIRVKTHERGGVPPNDLLDKRDQVLKKLSSFLDLSTHKSSQGDYVVEIRGVGPLVVGGSVEKFSVVRSPADSQGKPEGAFDLKSTSSAQTTVTHMIKGGKFGALLETRDQILSTVLNRLDELALAITNSVNEIHRQGISRNGQTGLDFFKQLRPEERGSAAQFMALSDAIQSNINHIATAAERDAPGDNRIALAIAGLQHHRLVNEGKTTVDDFYNSIVSDVGVAAARTRSAMNQQKDIQIQLNRMRDQIAGVSIDEETANLLQYQHAFDASAKVIQVANEMLNTVLKLKPL